MSNIISAISMALQNYIDKLYSTFIEDQRYMLLVEGLGNTLLIAVGALCIGVVIGSIIAVGKYFAEGDPRLKIVKWLCDAYTTVIRGIPVVVLLLICFFLVLKKLDGVTVAVIAFGINSGAYVAEIVRSGIQAVDIGQMEAGRSLGMSRGQTMWQIILPQAMKNILPAIGNEMISLLKETSVAGYVAVVDLTRAGNLIRNNTYDAFNPLMVVALTYLVMVIGLTSILGRAEKALRRGDKR